MFRIESYNTGSRNLPFDFFFDNVKRSCKIASLNNATKAPREARQALPVEQAQVGAEQEEEERHHGRRPLLLLGRNSIEILKIILKILLRF